MRTIIFIFVCFLFACEEVDQCRMIRISDALPVQFWPTGYASFEEEEACNIEKYCWNYEAECDDVVPFQLTSDTPDNYLLVAYDENDNELFTNAYTKTLPNLFDNYPLSGFTEMPGLDNSWILGSQPNVTISGIGGSKVLTSPIAGLQATGYTFSYEVGATDGNLNFTVKFMREGVEVSGGELNAIGVDNGGESGAIDFTLSAEPDEVRITAFRTSPVGFSTFTIESIAVPNSTEAVHNLSIIGSENGLCEKLVRFRIFSDPAFPSLDEWESIEGDWTVEGETVETNVPAGLIYGMGINFSLPAGDHRIDFDADMSGADDFIPFTLYFYNEGGDLVGGGWSIPLSNGSNVNYIDVSLDEAIVRIEFTVDNVGSTPIDFTLNSLTTGVESVEIAHSDLIKFTTELTCGTKIQYKSKKDFAGIVWSPDSEYITLRVPGRFFHPDIKTEYKNVELSSGADVTTGTLFKKGKRLQVQDAPEYFHDKLVLVLQHAASGSVRINNREWKIGGTYEMDSDRPDTYPLYPAEIILALRNVRNVI